MIRVPAHRVPRRQRPSVVALAIFAFAVVAQMTASARAQDFGVFELIISEKEQKLQHPNDMMWDKWLMWDTASQREDERNMPYLELKNISTSSISEFHLTIGDLRFNFGAVEGTDFAVLGSTTPGYSLMSSTVGSGDAANELVVQINGAGLGPGELVRFKINIDVDTAFADDYAALFAGADPDFRTVLFDMNGTNVYDGNTVLNSSADNAQAWVVAGGMATVPMALPDYAVEGDAAGYYNNNYPSYGRSDPVGCFPLTGMGVIPEPGGATLAIVALLYGICFTGRSRRLT